MWTTVASQARRPVPGRIRSRSARQADTWPRDRWSEETSRYIVRRSDSTLLRRAPHDRGALLFLWLARLSVQSAAGLGQALVTSVDPLLSRREALWNSLCGCSALARDEDVESHSPHMSR